MAPVAGAGRALRQELDRQRVERPSDWIVLVAIVRAARLRDFVAGVPAMNARLSDSTGRATSEPGAVQLRRRQRGLPGQTADSARLSRALVSARSVFRAGSAGDRFHDRPPDAGASRVAPPAL